MKKLSAIVLLSLASVPAMAQHYHGHSHYYRHYHGSGGWEHVLGGAILGAVIYDIYNRPVVVQQPQVVVQNPPVIVQQNCTPWTETRYPDGTVTRTRTCNQ
jgi:hypothetical protein